MEYDLTPQQWRDKLVTRLNFDTPINLLRLAWYLGEQLPPVVPKKYKPSYELLLAMSTNPFAGLVIDTISDRLELTGMRLDQPQADLDIWRILEDNHIDATQAQVHTEALVMRYGYMSVSPVKGSDPSVVPESALQVTHEEDPATRKTIAAGKLWTDDLAELVYFTLYLPDELYEWEADIPIAENAVNPDAESDNQILNQQPGRTYDWRPRGATKPEDLLAEVDDPTPEPTPNPLGEVPIVPFPNRPGLVTGGVSEIDPLIPILKRIDKLTLDMMLAAEVGAFKQKWATGIEIPVDPDTKKAVDVFDAAIRKLWTSENPETKFGDFNATDLNPYINSVDSQVSTLSSISRVPAYYLLSPSLVNPPSAETAQAADAGLVKKVEAASKAFGESYEQVVRLVLIALDRRDEAESTNMESVWEDPRIRSEAQVADAAVKWATLGVPEEVLWTWAGATPEEVQRWRIMNAQTQLTNAVLSDANTVGSAVAEQEADPEAAPSGPQVAEAEADPDAEPVDAPVAT